MFLLIGLTTRKSSGQWSGFVNSQLAGAKLYKSIVTGNANWTAMAATDGCKGCAPFIAALRDERDE